MNPEASSAEKRNRFVPEDEHLHFSTLLDPEVAATVLREHIPDLGRRPLSLRVGHIRYHPSVSCTICYHVGSGGGPEETTLYAKCVDQEGFQDIQQKNAGQRWVSGSLLPGPVSLPQHQAIVYEFPNDGRIANLREVVEPRKLTRTIAEHRTDLVPDGWEPANRSVTWQVMRYKPESRLVSLCESLWCDEQGHERRVPFLLRVERGRHADRVFRLMRRLHSTLEGATGVSVPKALFCEPSKGLTVLEYVGGVKLSETLRESDGADAISATAGTLAFLHSCRDRKLPERTPAIDLERATQTARLLSYCGGEIREQAAQIVRRLVDADKSASPGYYGFVHGDFHQGQVLCDEGAQRILDFDRAYNGDTTADIGNFLAQVESLQLGNRLMKDVAWDELFLSGYQRASQRRVPADRLKFWTAIRLFEVAAKEFRRLKYDWPGRVTAILNRCEAILEQ